MYLIRGVLLLLFFNSLCCSLHAESGVAPSSILSSKLERYSRLTYPQKLYLQTDREMYFCGDTIWFSAWLTNANSFLPDRLEKILYVELHDLANQLLSKHLFKLDKGRAFGQIKLQDFDYPVQIKLTAYTNFMRNAGEPFFFNKEFQLLPIVSEKSDSLHTTVQIKTVKPYTQSLIRSTPKKAQPSYEICFLPEGGYMVAGLPGRVAFVATDSAGNPAGIKGEIVDEQGAVAAFFHADSSGKGIFNFTPKPGVTYHATIMETEQPQQKVPLPKSLNKGRTMMVNNRWKDGHLDVRIHSLAEESEPLLLAVTQKGKLVQSFEFQTQSGGCLLRIDKSNLHTGIAQLTLFEQGLTPLLERLVYINNGDYLSFESEVVEDDEYHQIILSVEDRFSRPVQGNFAVSVFTEGTSIEPKPSSNNIVEYFYLESELPGLSADYDYFFKDDHASHKRADLTMMTNGWRRFKWEDVLADTVPNPKHFLEDGFYISGVIAKNPLFKQEQTLSNIGVTFMAIGSNLFFGSTKSNKDGRFSFALDDFNDTVDVVVQTRNRKDKTRDFEIVMKSNMGKVRHDIWQSPSLEVVSNPTKNSKEEGGPNYAQFLEGVNEINKEQQRQILNQQYKDTSDVLLEEVEVSARKKLSSLERMHGLYGFEKHALGTERIESITKEEKWNSGLFSLLTYLFPEIDVLPVRIGSAYYSHLPRDTSETFKRIHDTDEYTIRQSGGPIGRFYFFVDGQMAGFTNHLGNLDWAMAGLVALDADLVKSIGVITNPRQSPLPDAVTVHKQVEETHCDDIYIYSLVTNYSGFFIPTPAEFIVSIQTKDGNGLGRRDRNTGLEKSAYFGFTAPREFYAPPVVESDGKKLYAPTIFWHPNVRSNDDGIISISIRKERLPDKFKINVTGISNQGVPGYSVLPKLNSK